MTAGRHRHPACEIRAPLAFVDTSTRPLTFPRQLRGLHWRSPHGITPEMLVGQVFGEPGCLPRSLLTTLVKHLTDPAAHHEATRCIRRYLDGRQLRFPGTHPPSGAKEPGPTRVSISPPVPSEDAAAPSTSTIHRRDVNDAFPVASQRLVRHPRHCGAINGNVTLFHVGASTRTLSVARVALPPPVSALMRLHPVPARFPLAPFSATLIDSFGFFSI